MKINYLAIIPAALIAGVGVYAISTHAVEPPHAPPSAVEDPNKPGIKYLHCNNQGEVDGIIAIVDQPGTYKFVWNVAKTCGQKI